MASHEQTLHEAEISDFPLGPPGRMTEEEFVAWCDEDTRAEWVDGDVVMMSPANYEHTDLGDWLTGVLRAFVEHHDLGTVLSDFQVRLPRRRRAPDIVFVAKQRRDIVGATHVEGAPDLVVEIVSPDSQARDWREKYLEYQAEGVREYWVIDPMSRHAEVYALGGSPPGQAQTGQALQYHRLEEKEGVIASTVLPAFVLRTAWLWPETRPKLLEALKHLGVV